MHGSRLAALSFSILASTACSLDAPSRAEEDVDEGEADLSGDRRIDPIEVGHAWTYDVTVLGWYPACAPGVHTATALASVRHDGRDAVRVQSLCKYAGTFDYAVEGDRVWSWYDGAWRLSLDAPVRSGRVWSDDWAEYTWERLGTVKVPAGTFRSCWSATKRAPYPSFTVFCRGVGPVHWHYEDGLGNGYDALLIAKSF